MLSTLFTTFVDKLGYLSALINYYSNYLILLWNSFLYKQEKLEI